MKRYVAHDRQTLGKIGRRILFWFAGVALLPVLFMGWQGYQAARSSIEREVFLHMEAVAVSKQLAIEQWFRERRSDIRVLSSNPQLIRSLAGDRLDSADLAAAQDLLLTYLEQSEAYAEICLHDARGEPVACTMNSGGFVSAATRAGLIQLALASSDPVISEIYLRSGVGPSLHMAAAVRNSARDPLGVVITTLTLAQSLDPLILDTTGLGRTGQAYLLDDHKVMLTPSRFMNHPDPLTHTMDSEGIRAALRLKEKPGEQPRTGVYEGYDGEAVLGAWAYLPEQGWALIAEINADEAFAPLGDLKRNTIIVALITLGAIFIAAWLVSQSISLPIRRLAEASAAVSRGDLERRVMVDLNDELGELARRFNQMVTALRDYQQRIVKTERLAAIGELAASVVHEIRNPLSSVKMNLQILESKCAKDDVTAEQFAIARGQAEKLERLLSALLNYAKPEQLHLQQISLETLLRNAINQVRQTRGDRLPEIAVELADGSTPIDVDPERLEQVIENLVQNSAQAMNGNGRVTVRGKRELLSERSFVSISVTDNGPGVRADQLPHVFDPFFTTRKEGTGLGLSIAKKIVEAHGGQISIQSEPGNGTEVLILIPTERVA